MALFGRRPDSSEKAAEAPSGMQPVPAKSAYCRVCRDQRTFSRCWLRAGHVHPCTCCKAPFDNVASLYKKNLPACPRCGEFLEQPGFVYGLCDGCGSKFELMDGSLPSLLPNLNQRREMGRFGKAWSPD